MAYYALVLDVRHNAQVQLRGKRIRAERSEAYHSSHVNCNATLAGEPV